MYENIFTLIVKGVGEKLYAIRTAEIGLNAPEPAGNGKYKIVSVNFKAGTTVLLTGRAIEFGDGKIAFQIRYGDKGWGYILEENMNDWRYHSLVNHSETDSVQKAVNEILKNNQHILENNLLCARMISLYDKKGIAVPKEHRQLLYNLQARLQNRNTEIKKQATEVQEAQSPNFNGYGTDLQNFMQNPKIGLIISTTLAIVIIAVLVILTGTTAYLLFDKFRSESKQDIKYSDELTLELKKYLPADVYNQLIKENKANADQFNKIIDKASGKGMLKTAGYAAAGVLGFMFLTNVFANSQKGNYYNRAAKALKS